MINDIERYEWLRNNQSFIERKYPNNPILNMISTLNPLRSVRTAYTCNLSGCYGNDLDDIINKDIKNFQYEIAVRMGQEDLFQYCKFCEIEVIEDGQSCCLKCKRI